MEKKRAVDEEMLSNEKLSEDPIAKGEEKNAPTCEEWLRKRSDIKTRTETLLKSGFEGVILRGIKDAKQSSADVRVNSAADNHRNSGNSQHKVSQLDDEQKEHDD